MADAEDQDELFEQADAGASHTEPTSAGSIKKNNHVVIKGRPCKVMDVSTAKTGKHGHAKCTFTGLDVFNGKKYEDVIPAHQNVDVPYVKRRDYTLLDIQDDGFVSLLDDNTGDTKDDLKLPDDNEQLSNQIQKMMDEGKTVTCTVLALKSPKLVVGGSIITLVASSVGVGVFAINFQQKKFGG